METIYTTMAATTQLDLDQLMVVFGFIMMACLVIAVIAYIFVAIFMGKIFVKAGVPSWKAWVPFLSTWKFFEIGGQTGALSLLILIPYVGSIPVAVLSYIAAYNIGLKLGKSGSWVAMYIFLAPVWLILLGSDHNPWNDAVAAPSKAPETAAMYAAYYGQQPAYYGQQPPTA
jgi:hypothetical protein